MGIRNSRPRAGGGRIGRIRMLSLVKHANYTKLFTSELDMEKNTASKLAYNIVCWLMDNNKIK